MSQRILAPIHDGDQGPTLRFPVRDGAGYRDLATAAVEVYFEDRDGTSLGMRPGVITQAKSTGQIDVTLKGRESDWAGLGRDIVAIPKFYYAEAPDRTPATNLLLNPSFDSDAAPADGLADNWTVTGTFTGSKSVITTGPAPAFIFGSVQTIACLGGDAAVLGQSVLVTAVAGDVYSCGVWHRVNAAAEAASDDHALSLGTTPGMAGTTFARLRVGTSDWYYTISERTLVSAATAVSIDLPIFGTTGQNRFDDALLFKGKFYVFFGERTTLPVKPRSRPLKTSNQLAGMGSFEQDSNADGVADRLTRVGAGNTYSMDQDPANVSIDAKSQKVALTGAAAEQGLRVSEHQKYTSGETWKAEVKYKNSGALSGAPAASEFGLEIRTEDFDTTFVTATTAFALTSTAAFTTVSAQIVLLADANALEVRLNLAVAGGGNVWLDDLRLYKV